MSCFVVQRDEVTIISSNIAEKDASYPLWVAGTYALGTEVQYGQDIFRSLTDGNTATPVAETLTLNWKYLKKANRWACFDDLGNTITSNPLKIEYVVQSRYIDYIGFFNLIASSVKIELFNLNDNVLTATPLASKEEITSTRDVYNYTSYITALEERKKISLIELFPYFNTKMRITITANSGNASVGNIVYGRKYQLGTTIDNSSLSMDISNLFDVDINADTGEISEVPYMPRKDLTIPIVIETRDWERVTNKLTELIGKACLYVANQKTEDLPDIALFGFYKTIRTPIGATHTQYELTIKGIV